jgi:hypothetical protein
VYGSGVAPHPGPRISTLTQQTPSSARSLENFRGDYAAVAALMQRSWAENHENPLLYTEEFLRSAFEYPGAGVETAPAIYQDGQPVAFIAGFPRRVMAGGRDWNLALNTFLTAAPEVKGKGYGLALWAEFVKRAQKLGYDGTIGFCVDGEEMNTFILGCSRAFRHSTERIASIPYFARLLRPADDLPGEGDVEIFLEAAAGTLSSAAFARVWSHEEAEWQCLRRHGAVCVSHTAGPRRGALTGYIAEIADRDRTRCLMVEDLLWGTLEGEERRTLLQRFLQRGSAAGAKMAVAPQMGYADLEPLVKGGGFRRSRRLVHAYLTIWEKPWPLAERSFDRVYVDVF